MTETMGRRVMVLSVVWWANIHRVAIQVADGFHSAQNATVIESSKNSIFFIPSIVQFLDPIHLEGTMGV